MSERRGLIARITDALRRQPAEPEILPRGAGRVFWPGDGSGDVFPGAWQMDVGRPFSSALSFSAVYACISILSGDVSKLPLRVYEKLASGGRREVSPKDRSRAGFLAYTLLRPNGYQTGVEFLGQMMNSLLYDGNAYAYIRRNGLNNPDELYPLSPRSVTPLVAQDGSVFYQLGHDALNPDLNRIVPARFISHWRAFTMKDPLCGVTPIVAACASTAAGMAILNQSASFFARMSRPSGALKTDKLLNSEAVDRLRTQWTDTYASGANAGKVVVLEDGLSWEPLTMTATDAQLIEQLRFNVEDVARCYRVPQFMLGDLSKVTYKNAESLTRIYIANVLGFYLNLIEARFEDQFFEPGDAFEVEFDLEELLSADSETRFANYERGVRGGFITPNEARDREGLPPKPGGNELLVQAQMVPLDGIKERADKAASPSPPPAPAPKPDAATTGEGDGAGDTGDGGDTADELAKAFATEFKLRGYA